MKENMRLRSFFIGIKTDKNGKKIFTANNSPVRLGYDVEVVQVREVRPNENEATSEVLQALEDAIDIINEEMGEPKYHGKLLENIMLVYKKYTPKIEENKQEGDKK